MSRNLMIALILIAITVIVLLFNNSGKISVDLIVTSVSAAKAMVLLAFTAAGVIIGLLLR